MLPLYLIKDNKKVTIRKSQLFNWKMSSVERFVLLNHLNKIGNMVLMDIEGVTTVWRVNRANETLVTDAFPSKLRLPKVKKPVEYKVSNIKPIIVGVLC